MKNFKEFIKESKEEQWVKLENIFIRKYGRFPSIDYLNNKIENYIEEVYGPMGYVKFYNNILNIGGIDVNIQLMINNYTIFKKFIRENRIETASEFVNKLIASFDDVYNYNGAFFNSHSKFILNNTSKKGKESEKRVFNKFIEFSKSKGMDVKIIEPTSIEDSRGIDGYFFYKNKKYTIQVKPFSEITPINANRDSYKARSEGSLSINTDLLFLYNGDKFIFVKNKNESPILIKSEYFIFKKDNIFYKNLDLEMEL